MADYKGGGESLFKLADGQQFRWNSSKFYGGNYTFALEDGRELIHFEGSRLDLAPEAALLPAISLLSCFGVFLKRIRDWEIRAFHST
jgi:hypothetical protein